MATRALSFWSRWRSIIEALYKEINNA
jgi:hypothetical protein